jgi:ankyrin repeat protein
MSVAMSVADHTRSVYQASIYLSHDIARRPRGLCAFHDYVARRAAEGRALLALYDLSREGRDARNVPTCLVTLAAASTARDVSPKSHGSAVFMCLRAVEGFIAATPFNLRALDLRCLAISPPRLLHPVLAALEAAPRHNYVQRLALEIDGATKHRDVARLAAALGGCPGLRDLYIGHVDAHVWTAVFAGSQRLLRSANIAGGELTPLACAAAQGLELTVARLLKENARPTADQAIEQARRAWLANRWTGDDRALLFAACNGHLAVVTQLVLRGVGHDGAVTRSDDTPLLVAVCRGHLDVVRYLLAQGSAATRRNNNNDSALHLAAFHGHADVAAVFLTAEAQTLRNFSGDTPLTLAAFSGHAAVVKMLLHAGSDSRSVNGNDDSALHLAAFNGNAEIVALFVDVVDVGAKNKSGDTPMTLACYAGHLDVVRLLLTPETMAAVNGNSDSALTLAAFNGHAAVVRLLLGRGCDAAHRNRNNDTALHLAAYSGGLAVVEIISAAPGADTIYTTAPDASVVPWDALALRDARNNSGDTPLTLAAFGGHIETVKYLLGIGCSADILNNAGETALSLARRQNNHDVVELFAQRDITK